MKKLATLLLPLILISRAFGYGDEGHQAVGAIADGLLKNKPNTATQVYKLIDGMTLEQVAVLPDKIKDWDYGTTYHVAGHPGIEADLRDFWSANLSLAPSGEKMHHVFHYTDVSIATAHPTYKDGAIGTYAYDIVHMIPMCINVLTGDTPEDNTQKITKPVAVILLAHYLGDIHQPLHVGAAYFDDNFQLVTPKTSITYYPDQGGNFITLYFQENGKDKSQGKLHHYWDTNPVLKAFNIKAGQFTDDVVAPLIATAPASWQPAAGSKPADWAKTWADEILPIAREAHTRLKYEGSVDTPQSIKAYIDDSQNPPTPYDQFAADTVKDEIHKGGWRLEYLFEQIFP